MRRVSRVSRDHFGTIFEAFWEHFWGSQPGGFQDHLGSIFGDFLFSYSLPGPRDYNFLEPFQDLRATFWDLGVASAWPFKGFSGTFPGTFPGRATTQQWPGNGPAWVISPRP